ncbi:MAG: DHH family phosphoesterase [Eubacterium sp.]|nr:DHH family phosphoesterase [Eubacterium sp.]
MIDTAFEEKLVRYSPVPVVVVNSNGKVVRANDLIGTVFIYDELTGYDFFQLTGFKIDDLKEIAATGESRPLSRNDRTFRVMASRDSDDEEGNILVSLYDVTSFMQIKEKYDEEKICVARINIDNYDDLISGTDPSMRMVITSQLDKIIRDWSARIKGSIVTMRAGQYIMYFQHKYLSGMIEQRFSILDQVRDLETQTDFPLSLSIGVGINGPTLGETRNYADAAIDLALGRGGDQAVMRDGTKIRYFGGQNASVEKGSKGKSRVVAYALKRLIEQAERVIVMSHRNPDMDAFGSQLGMARICQLYGKNANIIVDHVNDSLQTLYKQAKDAAIYNFITSERALELITPESLVVLLDTHRPSYSECPEVLEKAEKLAVIDHHRRSADGVENPVLSYIESYASSTSEMVTEILQYLGAKKELSKLEAEALLAGMTVDTNRFAVKTGGRTFEAAAWLKRAGADTAEVKRLFQTSLEDLKIRSSAVTQALITEDGIATTICDGMNPEAQIINSEVADELLNVKGVKASFVAGKDHEGATLVSARSLGEVNVQVLMESIGGGGHLTTAGAQVDAEPDEIIEIVRKRAAEQLKVR